MVSFGGWGRLAAASLVSFPTFCARSRSVDAVIRYWEPMLTQSFFTRQDSEPDSGRYTATCFGHGGGAARLYSTLAGAEVVLGIGSGQTLYLGLGYIRKGEDQVNYDPGDVTGFDFGFSSPVTNRDFQWQGGLLFVWQSSDKFRDTDLSTRENRVDLSLGTVLWQRLRFGFQWPLLTDSEFRQHTKQSANLWVPCPQSFGTTSPTDLYHQQF